MRKIIKDQLLSSIKCLHCQSYLIRLCRCIHCLLLGTLPGISNKIDPISCALIVNCPITELTTPRYLHFYSSRNVYTAPVISVKALR